MAFLPNQNTVFASLLVALAALLVSCSSQPEEYDYHGSNPDLATIDNWAGDTTTPPIDVHLEVTPGDAIDDEFTPEDGSEDGNHTELPPTDYSDDQTVVVENVRECTARLTTASSDGTAVFVAGDFTQWADGQLPLTDDGNGTWSIDLDLSSLTPGSHAYKFHTAGDNWYADSSNPMTVIVDDIENSKLLVPDCRVPELRVADKEISKTGLSVTVDVYNNADSTGVLPATAEVFVNGESTGPAWFKADTGTFQVEMSGLPEGSKVSLLFTIDNEFGSSAPLFVPLWLDEGSWTWHDSVIYFAFTDRFSNGDSTNDAPQGCSQPLVDWVGGDFKGIQDKVEEGYFEQLGVNVLWISPTVDNPNGCVGGNLDGVQYSAYHGYFPSNNYTTEEHFGTMTDLISLVNAAHDRGIRVIVDFVANHVYSDNEIWQEHGSDGWFHESYPCKPNWDKPIECWFEQYLPDLSYANDAVVEWMTENALFWIRASGIDGFRVDAVKHMRHAFLRTLRWKIARYIESDSSIPFYMVGETFTGEWGDGSASSSQGIIKEYIGPWELNAQFDFPYYWKILRIAGRDAGDFTELVDYVQTSQAYWGEGNLMVGFIGNHDVPRFASHANGDIADQWGNGSQEQGLNNPPAQPPTDAPYRKTQLALGLTMTLPEIPMIYYGDEIALAGAGDPDNRRPMVFEGLSSLQDETLNFVKVAGQARRDLSALRRGSFVPLETQADALAFARIDGDQKVVVVANRSSQATSLTFSAGTVSAEGDWNDLLSDSVVAFSGNEATVQLNGFQMMILQPQEP